MKTKLVKRGPYSYALPISKETLKELNINPENDKIHLTLNTSKYSHQLVIEKEDEYRRNQKKSTLSQMFDDFFNDHPEIKDRQAYLKRVYEQERKENPDLF